MPESSDFNVLVTGVGGDIGQSIIKCIRSGFDSAVIVGTDIDKYAAGASKVDRFYLVPLASESSYIDSIRSIALEESIHVIIPSTEIEISVLSKHKKELNDHFQVMINKPEIISTFFDKFFTVSFLAKNNLPFPRTFLLDDFNGQIDYPFLIKLRRGSGSRGVHFIGNSVDFDYYRRLYPNSIVQEILGDSDHEYTVGVFSYGEEVHSITFRRYLGFGGMSRYVETVENSDIKILAEKIARVTGLRGSINVQLRLHKGIPVPFEINPRISSTVYFRHYFGFKDLVWWLEILRGRNPKIDRVCLKGIGVRTVGEVFFDI